MFFRGVAEQSFARCAPCPFGDCTWFISAEVSHVRCIATTENSKLFRCVVDRLLSVGQSLRLLAEEPLLVAVSGDRRIDGLWDLPESVSTDPDSATDGDCGDRCLAAVDRNERTRMSSFL